MSVARLHAARRLGTASVAVVAAVGSLGGAGLARAAGPGSGAVGYVYLDDNTAVTNTVAGFARQADGSLTPLPGSPFTAGGSGTGSGLASQGAVQVTPDGRYLLAADAASNQISVLQIGPGGALVPVAGSPFSSGGSDPVSIAVHGSLVYVANAGAAASNYSGFTLSAAGQLTALPNSSFTLPSAAQPGDVLFNGDGSELVGTRVASSQIDSFAVGATGLLAAAPGSPYAAQGLGPFGSEFRPTNPSQLFVSNAHDGTGLGTVSAFSDAANGALTPIGSSPFADLQTAPCWVVISPDGQYLYAVNTGSGAISSYSIAADGTLTLLSSTPVSNSGGVGAVDPALSPDGHTLYVNESRVGAVGEFTVNGGTITELAGSPIAVPAGAAPAGIALPAPTSLGATVSASVAPTLSLSVGGSASLGAFVAGVGATYTTSLSATTLSTAASASLTVADPDTSANAGHLVNGSYALAQPLRAAATDATTPSPTYGTVGGLAAPLTLLSYGAPVSNDAVTLWLQQPISATDPLRTGTYTKTLVFTLQSTTL